jgi:hypothetical protein
VRVADVQPGWPLWTWTALSLGGMAALYAAIRSGWSRRFADPSLTAVQIAFAITSAATGYAQAGLLRGGAFPVLTLSDTRITLNHLRGGVSRCRR